MEMEIITHDYINKILWDIIQDEIRLPYGQYYFTEDEIDSIALSYVNRK